MNQQGGAVGNVVAVNLEDLWVHPQAVSPRSIVVDEAYLGRLTDAIEGGEDGDLPALKVAEVTPTDPQWGGKAPMARTGGAARRAKQDLTPWTNFPPLPRYALYDGHTVYWALVQSGITSWRCEVVAQAVETVDELRSLAYAANLRHGRTLTDGEVAHGFARLWLGRDPRASGEDWKPGRGAKSAEEIQRLIGYSPAWQRRMTSALPVIARVELDLPIRSAVAIAKLPSNQWHSFVWADGLLREHLLRDERDTGTVRTLTVPRMTVSQVARAVELEIQRIEGRQQAEAEAAMASPTVFVGAHDGAEAGTEDRSDLLDQAMEQVELPMDWTEFIGRSRDVHAKAHDLSDEQLVEAICRFTTVHIATRDAYNKLIDEAVNRRLEERGLIVLPKRR